MPAANPDELSEYERERGKPAPSWFHTVAQTNLTFELAVRYRQEFEILSEIDIAVSGRVMVPDIGIFSPMLRDMAQDVLVVQQLPFTTIEIISGNQPIQDLVSRAEFYFQAGVKSCWVVVPVQRGVFVYSAPNEYIYFQGDDIIRDPATGIKLELAPLFE